ncbi:hypothetical protein [Telluria aromaticivorans]|uniref:Uncharacterized protein n=1 Tax=Telluria aromaticivorans TaxID=2725995 RepID=A0A7Y2K2C5_9BURK|nr:hypothetical protein [Telluria aromaticivorans]NNG24903.1 hypothetical protein [Telluria aromaticivorans]
MQQPPKRVPSSNANLVIAALLGIPGMINLVGGVMRDSTGDIISGIAALAYAALLVRDAMYVKKTGVPAMPQARMLLIGFGCLAVYLVGLLIKHS